MTHRHQLIQYDRVGRGAEARAGKKVHQPNALPLCRLLLPLASERHVPFVLHDMHATCILWRPVSAPVRHFGTYYTDMQKALAYIRNRRTTQPVADQVTWYENTDGQGTFALGLDVSTTADGAMALAIADIDGDRDLDIVSASQSAIGVQWFENTNGKGAFSLANSLEPANPANYAR